MPCMCWYEPPEASRRMIKNCCKQIVDEIKLLEKEGDPEGCTLLDVKMLLDHLYSPSKCKGRPNE